MVTDVCNNISKMEEDLNSYVNKLEDLVMSAKLYEFCLEDEWFSLTEKIDRSVEPSYPFDFPDVWLHDDISFDPIIPNNNITLERIFNGTSELPADFLEGFGFETARVELRQKLLARCDARQLLEATFLESDEIPFQFIIVVVAIVMSTLLGPCVTVMLRNHFAWKYPV